MTHLERLSARKSDSSSQRSNRSWLWSHSSSSSHQQKRRESFWNFHSAFKWLRISLNELARTIFNKEQKRLWRLQAVTVRVRNVNGYKMLIVKNAICQKCNSSIIAVAQKKQYSIRHSALNKITPRKISKVVSLLRFIFFHLCEFFQIFFAAAVEQIALQTLLYMISERKF